MTPLDISDLARLGVEIERRDFARAVRCNLQKVLMDANRPVVFE